jgi:histidinol-phosphatase (PHP family)
MVLPADSHVHSEWSWDTGGPGSSAEGTMRATCERAVRIGLPALFFTEHLDVPGAWRAGPDDIAPELRAADGSVVFAPFDADGYFESIERMRHAFPELRIGTGVEFGQPHLFGAEAATLVDLDRIDRVLGSLHILDLGSGYAEPITLFREHDPATVLNAYLEQVPVMVAGSDAFEVFTHIDYFARYWPSETAGPFDPRPFEEGFRHAMRSIADGGRALEMNTRRLWPWIPQWWSEEGGRAVSLGSDAHTLDALASGLPEAAAMLEHFGFAPGARPEDLWTR